MSTSVFTKQTRYTETKDASFTRDFRSCNTDKSHYYNTIDIRKAMINMTFKGIVCFHLQAVVFKRQTSLLSLTYLSSFGKEFRFFAGGVLPPFKLLNNLTDFNDTWLCHGGRTSWRKGEIFRFDGR